MKSSNTNRNDRYIIKNNTQNRYIHYKFKCEEWTQGTILKWVSEVIRRMHKSWYYEKKPSANLGLEATIESKKKYRKKGS